eukprot:7668091-Alexandrium_andersonii.AAC.1
MAEVAKESAIRNLTQSGDMNHADLSEKAKAATRSVSIQSVFKTVVARERNTTHAPNATGEFIVTNRPTA